MAQNYKQGAPQNPYALSALPSVRDAVPPSSIRNRAVAGPYDLSTPPATTKSAKPKASKADKPKA